MQLNWQALAIEEAEGNIRKEVKDARLARTPDAALNARIDKIIRETLRKIKIPALWYATRKSLLEFYRREWRLSQRMSDETLTLLSAFVVMTKKRGLPVDASSADAMIQPFSMGVKRAETVLASYGYDTANLYGAPLQKYMTQYVRSNVLPVVERMAKEHALDPDAEDYIERKQTLRARAEIEVRYQSHIDELDELRENGTRLVIISAHADCSDRCRPFQGKVFSLDGTRGVTKDGRQFVPLEEATQIPTPNGKWMNGLFGFNCRHYAVPYKDGFRFPKPNAAEERKEYAITQQQRAMERNVRDWKVKAQMLKGVDTAAYINARNKARGWDARYRQFSKENGRAYYPSRTKVL